MTNISAATSRRQRGFTLAEVTVATAVLVVVIVGALMLYDRGNRVFKESNESAEMQQNARIAYDRMVADLRMAGFDYMRGGAIPAASVPTPWAPTRAYAAGTVVTPVTPNGNIYRCTANGTSSNVEPSWPSSGSVTDGTTSWIKSGGIPSQQPDEQIEYINSAAITVRGNFDYSQQEPGDGDHGRETGMESVQFPVVTTGNSEIVTYALVSSRAAANTDSVQFFADVNSSGTPARAAYAGGSPERQITIPGVDLSNNNPPYTLYRFTLADNGSVVRTALAENIRSLTFQYFSDTAGRTPLKDNSDAYTPNTILGLGQFNPNTANAVLLQRNYRARIRSIRVRLVGMNENPDVNYQETSTANGIITTDATVTGTAAVPIVDTVTVTTGTNTCANCTMQNYRKMALDTLVVPRNLGLRGMIQTEDQPPVAPTITSVCVGFCGVAVVTWNTNTNQMNANYVVTYDTNVNGSYSGSSASTIGTSIAVDLTQGDRAATYSFRVRAFNSAGSALSDPVTASIANATKPGQVTNFVASGGSGSPLPAVAGRVRLQFSAPSTYSGTGSCTPSGTPGTSPYMREIRGFRIYRGTTAGFTADSSSLIVSETASGPTAPSGDGYGNFTYNDDSVISCATYYYRVQAIEWCANAVAENTTNDIQTSVGALTPAAGNNGVNGEPTRTGTPGIPPNVAVDTLNSSCNVSINTCSVRVTWSKVTQDVANQPVNVGSYEVEREQWLPTGITPVATTTATVSAAGVSGSTMTYNDTTAVDHAITNVKYFYKYRVRAVQVAPCAAGGWSGQVQYPPSCNFSGSAIVQAGATSGDGLTFGTAWSMNGGDNFQVTPPAGLSFVQVTMDVFAGTTAVSSYTTTSSPAGFSWVDQTPGTTYRLLFTMVNNSTPQCTQQLTRYVYQETPPGCTLNTYGAPTNDTTVITQPNIAGRDYDLDIKLVNSSNEALTLTGIDFSWAKPSRIQWDTVGFPSGGLVTLQGIATPASFTMNLNPRPITLTVADITVPANGTKIITAHFSRTSGGPTISVDTITTICVKYTRASVIAQTFLCRIKPGAGAGNPFSSCN